MSDQRLPRTRRIRQQSDFDRIHRQGVYAADQVLVVRGRRNQLDHTRLGVAVSRKVGSAVVRNRWKRWIREAFRRHYSMLPAGFDFVVRPRKGASGSYVAIARSLPRLCQRVVRQLERTEQSAHRSGLPANQRKQPADDGISS